MNRFSISLIHLCLMFVVVPVFASSAENVFKPLTVNTINYPPYSILKDEFDRKGSDVDVIEAAFKNRGHLINFDFVPIKRSLVELKNGSTFAMTICGQTEERLKYAHFTDPVSFFTLGFMYRKGRMNLENITWDKLRGRNLTIATVRGFVAEKELNTNSIKSQLVVKLSDGIKMLGRGRLKIFYAGMEASYEMARRFNYHKDLEFVRAPGHSHYDNYLCISKKWPNARELLADFNAGLKAIKANGTFDKILQKYKQD